VNKKTVKSRLQLEKRDDGVREHLFRLFLWPLAKFCPEGKSLKTFYEDHVFHFSDREIKRFRCDVPFKMPGLFRQTFTRAIQGYGYRDVQKGCILWTRKDKTVPDQVEVEAYIGKGKKEYHFLLTDKDFSSISDYLAPDDEFYVNPKKRKAVLSDKGRMSTRTAGRKHSLPHRTVHEIWKKGK
jgi:hypothetical protein